MNWKASSVSAFFIAQVAQHWSDQNNTLARLYTEYDKVLCHHSLPNTKQSFSLGGLKIQCTLLRCCGSLQLIVSWLPTLLNLYLQHTQTCVSPPLFPISPTYHSQQNPTQIRGFLIYCQFLEGFILLMQTESPSSEARGYSPRSCKFQQARLHLWLCKTGFWFL